MGFLLTLLATVVCGTLSLIHTYEVAENERLLGALVLVGLPLVLGQWFRRLRWTDPPVWWELRQRLPGAAGEPLPILERTNENPFFPLPWFLLPLIPVSVILGIASGSTILFLAPIAATLAWVAVVLVVAARWALTHRADESSLLDRMVADFRQGLPRFGIDSPVPWAHRVFDMHRADMDGPTLETLSRAGVEDQHVYDRRNARIDATRLPPWYAREGWLSVLERQGLIERDPSRRHGERTDLPQEMQGWQCPRCHTVNHPRARRCTLSGWWQERLCDQRRPGLGWIAYEVSMMVEVVVGVVFTVLVFAPILLAIVAIYGVLTLFGSGDPTGLVAATILAVAWLIVIRLPGAFFEEARESLSWLYMLLALVLAIPVVWPADLLRRAASRIHRGIVRARARVEVVVDGSTLDVQPRIVRPGKVRLRVSSTDSDRDARIVVMRTNQRSGALPDDLDEYLTKRRGQAVVVSRGWAGAGTPGTMTLSLTPGRYVIAAFTGADRSRRTARAISTLLVE